MIDAPVIDAPVRERRAPEDTTVNLPVHRSAAPLAPLLLLALFGCKGPDQEVAALTPVIGVAPAELDFGEVVLPFNEPLVLQVLNTGRADLEVSSITVSDNDDGAYALSVTEGTILREEVLGLEVVFSPGVVAEFPRTLTIESNDKETPTYTVPLFGAGVDGPEPDIEVTPLSLDFGVTAAPVTDWFVIKNTGDADLIIEGVDQSGSGDFASPNLPAADTVITPGSETTVIVTYTPGVTGTSGGFSIASNDPDEAVVDVSLIGNGGGEEVYPIAVINCPDSVNPPLTLPLDGTASYDPAGGTIVAYEWSIAEAPDGSSSSVASASADITSMVVDLAGDWEVDLVVVNDVGVRSAPARCEFDAIPEAAIHVELSWDTDDSDLDLHMVQAGASMYDSPEDVCWCNDGPDWGELGVSEDDPELALDNEEGYGPEDTRLLVPADGEYEIWAHYFHDKGGHTTTATVKVWINGREVSAAEVELTNNEAWRVGYVRWPEAVFVEESNEPAAWDGSKNCN